MKNTEGGSNELLTVDEEKDLGVTFDKSLNFSSHIHLITNKANKMMGIIKRTFENLDQEIFLPLYKSLVRSNLEYANTVWRPYKRKDIESIEKVQRRATKCIPQLSDLTYKNRLQKLKLPTLEYRRSRADMLQVYKIMHGLDDLNIEDLFILNNQQTRGNSLKIYKPQSRLNIRQNSFPIRVINDWNSLPENIVNAPTLNTFKNRLDKQWVNRQYEY